MRGTTNMLGVRIPRDIRIIEAEIFSECRQLENVYYEVTTEGEEKA